MGSSASPKKEEELYRPSIVRYKCRGATYLDLDQEEQPASHPFSFLGPAPRCVGIASRLQHIQDLPSPMTKERAIEKFVMETELPEDPDLHDPAPRQRTHMTEQTSNPSSSSSSPTRNQPPPPSSKAAPLGSGHNKKGRTILPNGVYDPYQHFVEQQHQVERIKQGETVDETDQFWTAWSCYGWTHVTMLLLEPYQDGSTHKANTESAMISIPEEAGEIASVHLDCSVGASISETEDNYGGTTVTSLRLGPIELRIHNHFEFEELQDGNKNRLQQPQQQLQQQESKQGVDKSKARPINKEDARPQSMLGRLMGRSSDEEETRNSPNKQKSSSQKDPGKKDEEEQQQDKEEEDLGTKFVNMTKKVANGMVTNAKFVAGEVSEEDFLERMVTSGDKIIHQMPVTLQRTKKVVMDVYNMWSGEDGHDNDPN